MPPLKRRGPVKQEKDLPVVASEVKKLANRTKDASNIINDILNNIQKKTELIVDYANNTSYIIAQQLDAVNETDNAFKTILEGMLDISEQINEVDSSVKEIVSLNEMTKNVLNTISVVSEQAASTSQEVSQVRRNSWQERKNSFSMPENLTKWLKSLMRPCLFLKLIVNK